MKEFVKPSVCEGERGEGGGLGMVMGCRWVVDALVKVREVEPGDVYVEGVADDRHVLLGDHTREVVYEWGEEKRGDMFAGTWRVE